MTGPKQLEILIVDDDKIMCLLQQKILLKLGIPLSTKSFYNGKEALDYILCHSERPKHFLILLDINMPVMNGWEFLQQSLENALAEKLTVAMVTSSINTQDKAKAQEFSQVIAFYEKPFVAEKAMELLEMEEVKGLLKSSAT